MRERAIGTIHTPLCDLLGITVPLLQAGMGRASGSPTTADLVVAVSEAGGLGCLGGTGLDPDQLRTVIREIRALTDRPFAVNLLLPVNLADADIPRAEVRREIRERFPEHLRFVENLYRQYGIYPLPVAREYAMSPTLIREQVAVVLEENPPVFVSALGDPGWVVPDAHDAGILVIGMAGSVRNAERQKKAGVDVVIAQGYEAGGHTGTVANFPLIPQVVDAVAPLPVVAAGGIGDGRGLVAALALGAQAAWCGTLFLFSKEIDLPEAHRDQLARARSEDLVVSRSYTGKPSRVVRNEILDLWAKGGLDPLPMPHQTVLMEDFINAAGEAGRWDLVNNPGGQIAGMLGRVEPAAALVERMVEEAASVIGQLAGFAR